MIEEEKRAIDFLKGVCTDDCVNKAFVVTPILNLIEKQQNKIQALEKQHDYDMQMIDEVKGNAVKWANELEQEKEKNKDLQKQLNGAFDRGFISKDKIRAKVIQVKDRPVKDEFITATQGKLNTIIVLEELLEEV